MSLAHPQRRPDEPAGAGSIAFLIFYAVVTLVLTGALWITYLS
jgi:hypothetical protein